tara:strand:+ start:582 stop:731 length:150 start_codon:yes stop_codon:yes gene_type:complete
MAFKSLLFLLLYLILDLFRFLIGFLPINSERVDVVVNPLTSSFSSSFSF